VKTTAVALNPADWKQIQWMNKDGLLVGSDYAGVVEETGNGYATGWKAGDRICGTAQGSDQLQPENGAFAEHIVVKADLQIPTPHTLNDEQAASLGGGVLTCALSLFHETGLGLDISKLEDEYAEARQEGEFVLVYGGSTGKIIFCPCGGSFRKRL
jgi:NADPH:quinone reductase-like Zn-dependent oxidoreductase